MDVFTSEFRDEVKSRLVAKAEADTRIVAAAAVGSTAESGDRWSDIDLSFGVRRDVALSDVLSSWSDAVVRELDSMVLFDVRRLTSIYRVFLLPGMLQLDLSFTPEEEFGALGARFKLLFGNAAEREYAKPAAPEQLFGLAVHHAVRAHLSLRRGRTWQAELWLHLLRDHALELACRRHGLDGVYGRGFDALPAEVPESFGRAFPSSLGTAEIGRALAVASGCLLAEGGDEPAVSKLRENLREILAGAAEDATDMIAATAS